MTRSWRRHSVRDSLLVLVLGVAAAAVSVLEWMAGHLIVAAGVALIIAAACKLGQRRRARPGQVQAAGPAVATLPVATLPLADDWDELGTRQSASLPAGSDRDSLLADPRSGARSLWGSS
jgi:hypothetical protein